jgi:hypothetical protein
MANGRNKGSKGDSGRDPGGFVALPWSVLDCAAYARLSHPARTLLMELARQFVKDNNGRLLLSFAYLSTRGWKSADVITRAKRALLSTGFIHETVMGHRPNKASWYAVTWRALDKMEGYDEGAEATFRRGAYMDNTPLKPQKTREQLFKKWDGSGRSGTKTVTSTKIQVDKNTSLMPPHGVETALIAPSGGVETNLIAPSHGAMEPVLVPPPTPSHGNHLDMPSIAVDSVCAAPDQQHDVIRVSDSDLDPARFHDGDYCPELQPAQHQRHSADGCRSSNGRP